MLSGNEMEQAYALLSKAGKTQQDIIMRLIK